MVPSYQNFDAEPLPKRRRRAKLDTRRPADIVPPELCVKIAAAYWLMRRSRDWRPFHATLSPYQEAEWRSELMNRLPARTGVMYDANRVAWPTPAEVAACCYSVRTSATYRYAFFGHLNSAAHLAQHFGVAAKDVIHEARMTMIASALSVEGDST